MKKILYIVLSAIIPLILIISMCFNVFAETYYVMDGYTYKKADYGVSIHAWDNSSDILKVPQLLGGSRVVAIDDFAFSKDAYIKQLDFSEATYLEQIGKMSFSDSSISGELQLTSTITDVGVGAFQGCNGLGSVIYNAKTSKIPNQCFMACSNMSKVVIFASINEIGPYAFQNCTSLKEITIPKTVTSISPSAFNGCSDFTIYCNNKSYAQEFAKNNGIDYKVIDPQQGDSNCDGSFNISDATAIQKYKAGLSELTSYGLKAADVNGDGSVTVRDATLIQMRIAGIIDEF